jgi:hypothetical protein
MKLTPAVLESEKICHIIAILPNTTDFLKLNTDISSFSFTVLEYGDQHNTNIDKKQFQECGLFIDSMAKKTGHRNVLVFCNNGYQRSIPFLVYYLTQHHSDSKSITCHFITN